MKVVRFFAPGDVRVEEATEPAPGPGDVMLRVRNCSTCGTDLKISRFGHPNIRPPRVIGHEIAGEVVEVGDGVDWGNGRAEVVIGIAAVGEGHLPVLAALAQVLMDPEKAAALRSAGTVEEVRTLLSTVDDDEDD